MAPKQIPLDVTEAEAGSSCKSAWDYNNDKWTVPFYCPRLTDDSDERYCCNPGRLYQRCCTYYEYYGHDEYLGLSVGSIVGIAIGSLVFIVAVIVSIIVCRVRCVKAAATPTHHPVTMHTVSMPQQPGLVTVPQPAAPGYYYPPSTQSVPPPNYAAQPAQQPPFLAITPPTKSTSH
ncbi:protein shisa-4-like [Patiria miniata]|uniref:Uncharacterized protein n=1 Tax=Patiria miniata TaxID=46514 RepID=A0A914B6W0_PATMI|nr:protein shisa-4-like [Patiria miniata]